MISILLYFQFLDTLQHGDWLTAIVKEITICDKQHSTSNSNGSDSTSPLFSTGDLVAEFYDEVYSKSRISGRL